MAAKLKTSLLDPSAVFDAPPELIVFLGVIALWALEVKETPVSTVLLKPKTLVAPTELSRKAVPLEEATWIWPPLSEAFNPAARSVLLALKAVFSTLIAPASVAGLGVTATDTTAPPPMENCSVSAAAANVP